MPQQRRKDQLSLYTQTSNHLLNQINNMLVFTQSHKNNEWDVEPKSSMGHRETNTCKKYINMDEEDITDDIIEEAQQDPGLQKLSKKLIETNKQKYFLFLSTKGVKIPEDFDTDQPKQTESVKRTKSRTYIYNTDHNKMHNHDNTNDQTNTNDQDNAKNWDTNNENNPLTTLT